MSKALKLISVTLLALVIFILPAMMTGTLVLASSNFAPDIPDSPITDVAGIVNLLDFISRLMFALFGVLAVIFIIWAAISYLTAGGDSSKVAAANQRLIYAVVAIIVALMAAGAQGLITNFLEQG